MFYVPAQIKYNASSMQLYSSTVTFIPYPSSNRQCRVGGINEWEANTQGGEPNGIHVTEGHRRCTH